MQVGAFGYNSPSHIAPMMKLVDIADLKSAALGRAGSIPARGTKL